MGWFAKLLPLLLWLLEQLAKAPNVPTDVKDAGDALKTALAPHAAKTAKAKAPVAKGHGTPEECVEAVAETLCRSCVEVMDHVEHLASQCTATGAAKP